MTGGAMHWDGWSLHRARHCHVGPREKSELHASDLSLTLGVPLAALDSADQTSHSICQWPTCLHNAPHISELSDMSSLSRTVNHSRYPALAFSHTTVHLYPTRGSMIRLRDFRRSDPVPLCICPLWLCNENRRGGARIRRRESGDQT